ncbi:MAG: hypothetical protein UT26_C0004G0005 [Microgenomates group bacterium GW2011_GWC1_39_12]|nr:MAG: hypothetical protein UT26_C0004G0005 [Microgenomates group bacterium GW2011_GWC1_39_12]
MSDITAIFLTQNEVPESWAAYHRGVLLESLNGAPLIIMSRKPMDWGTINMIQDKPKSLSNIYWQLLRAAKASTTDYVAVVEDDSLYPFEHFLQRPNKNCIGYNMNHWSVFTHGEPIYSWRNRRGNYSMLSYRKLVIEALEERFAKYPNGTPDNITGEIGRPMVEHNMGIALREVEEFETTVSIINFNHPYASDDLQLRQRKVHGHIRAYDIPLWGKASELIKRFK